MSDFFIGEIRTFPFGIVPKGWHLCDGSSLPVAQNQALYALIGNYFGGDNKNFNLPDLRGRAILGQAPQGTPIYNVGNKGGQETVTLDQTQIVQHNHFFIGDKASLNLVNSPGNALPATPASPACYAAMPQPIAKFMASDTIQNTGGQAHNNIQPSLVLNYCISTTGIFPSRQ